MANENIDPESVSRMEAAIDKTGVMYPSSIGVTGMVVGEGSDQSIVNIMSFIIEVDENRELPYNFGVGSEALKLLHQRLSELIPLMEEEEARLKATRN